jgi:hypothetical protein
MSGWRARLSLLRAQVKTALGLKSGFFIQYGYMPSVKPIEYYAAFGERCSKADLAPILAQLDRDDVRTDPFFQQSTSHLNTLDALVDYATVLWAKPKRIIEIGSGRSTHVLNRAIADMDGEGQITCIDPAPRLDISSLPVTIHRRTASPDDVDLVAQLQANDVLYIDSSHILMPGTDCDIEFNLLLPALQPGVLVHVHDIFLPYGYPAAWAPRNWNEACGLVPWVVSDAFEVIFPTYCATRERHDELYAAMPGYTVRGDYAGGSFWMRKR